MGNSESTGLLLIEQGILKSVGATNELSPSSKPFGFNAFQCVLMCINAHLKFALSELVVPHDRPVRIIDAEMFFAVHQPCKVCSHSKDANRFC
jgi:hypothetical protein